MKIETCVVWLGVVAAGAGAEPARPGAPGWPVAWSSYRKVVSAEADAADLKAHGVGLISCDARKADEMKAALDLSRRTGLAYHIDLPEVTESARLVRDAGLEPVEAVLIGGVYQGKAIDRHLFRFGAGKQEIVIEPPVYSKGLPYTMGSGGTGAPKNTGRVGHYFSGLSAPLRAEVVVPLKAFDGRQHLRVVPASVAEAPAGARLEADSAAPELASEPEIKSRTLYTVSFDLTGLDGALLDRVGVAVYWASRDQSKYWMFGHGNVSAWAETTRETVRREVRRRLGAWAEANGGAFPGDAVLAARYGDECFYITGHLNSQACSLPLRDYSEPSLRAFAARAGEGVAYPRTWGFPEVYGEDAYAWWLYSLHEGCAQLVGVAREEAAKAAPGLLFFRNTTRAGVFSPANDHDGSGQELLARQLDVVHLDPYPVSATGYSQSIPTDMSYCAGLARRYSRLLVPWMQAHTYGGPGGLTDVSPAQVDRMAEEQWAHGVDAVMWLGYGNTFPNVRPDSWERAAAFHARLAKGLPPKPKAELAALRTYRAWALGSLWEDRIRNPADWTLQQFLHVWAVENKRAYDVFELPPALTRQERARLDAELRGYARVVSTEPREGAWVLGEGTISQAVAPKEAAEVRRALAEQMRRRGWLPRP